MNKIILTLATVATLTSVAFAEAPKTPATMTPEQLAKMKEVRMRQTGGLLQIAGEGYLAVLNAQKELPDAALEAQADALRKCARDVDVKILPSTFSLATAQSEVKKTGAAAAIFIVDDAALPPSLIAMEEGWGAINVAKLKGADAKKLEARFGKEFVRVASVIFAGPQSQYKTSPLQTIRSVEELDKMVGDKYGMDATMAIMNNLPKIGVKPARMISYRMACQEGIAPAPTNDIQKAIWEQVHATPKRPMKIEFDAQKGR